MTQGVYRIKVKGRLDSSRSRWFEGYGSSRLKLGGSDTMAQHNVAAENMQAEMPEVIDAFLMKLHDEGTEEGVARIRFGRLTQVAISVDLRCDHCLQKHAEAAITAGASQEEILEAAWVGSLMARRPALAHSATSIPGILGILGLLQSEHKTIW